MKEKTREELFAEALDVIRRSNDEEGRKALEIAIQAVLELRKKTA